MKQEITMCKGIQGSGKTTFAKNLVKTNRNYVRVSNDELRLLFFDRRFDEKDTKDIDFARELLIEEFLKRGKSVVIDCMNLSEKYENRYKNLSIKYDCFFHIKDFTDVPLSECIERDSRREHPIGRKVITQTYNKFIRKDPPKIIYDINLPFAVWADLDGTTSIIKNRSPYEEEKCENDLVNEPVRVTIDQFHKAGYKIILCSGRDEGRGREATERWLNFHQIPYDHLFMRKAGDIRKDSIVKKEIYENEIKGKFNLLFCLDDRNQVVDMLRNELGLPVFQVAEGDF